MLKNKRYIVVSITLMLVLVMTALLAACSTPEPAKPDTTPAPNPPQKVTEWLAGYASSGQTKGYKFTDDFCNEIEKRTDGRLKIKLHTTRELGHKGAELPTIVQDNILQMSHFVLIWAAGELKGIDMTALPFLFTDEEGQIVRDLVTPFQQKMMEEHFNVMYLMNWYGYTHPFTTKQIKSPEDVKGLKLRVPSKTSAELFKQLGALVVSIPYAEIYTSLQQGIIEGNMANPVSGMDSHLDEVCKYLAICYVNTAEMGFLVNKDAFTALPKSDQDIFLDTAKEWQKKYIACYDEITPEVLQMLKERGVTVNYWSKEDLVSVRKMANNLWAEWAAEAGPDAQATLNKLLQALEKQRS
jgi:TRAP-type C4-dicarboxylate transport system substrate-binding protein